MSAIPPFKVSLMSVCTLPTIDAFIDRLLPPTGFVFYLRLFYSAIPQLPFSNSIQSARREVRE
jgi:hypothetical protein